MNINQRNRQPRGVPSGGEFTGIIHTPPAAVALHGNTAYDPVLEIGQVYSGHALDMEEHCPGITVEVQEGVEDGKLMAAVEIPATDHHEAFSARIGVGASLTAESLPDALWEDPELSAYADKLMASGPATDGS